MNNDQGALMEPTNPDLLAPLRPTRDAKIMDVVAEAGIDVAAWSKRKDGSAVANPRANPTYCYEWAFGGDAEPTLLCIWHPSLTASYGVIAYEDSIRQYALKLDTIAIDQSNPSNVRSRARDQAKRARTFDSLVQRAFRKSLPVRVVLLQGNQRAETALGWDTSKVRFRLLDTESWYVHSYRDNDGLARLVRTLSKGTLPVAPIVVEPILPSELSSASEASIAAVKVTPHVDPYLFQRQFEAFKAFVEAKSQMPFHSFAANPYTAEQEGYKHDVYRQGRQALTIESWTRAKVGAGEIAACTVAAIELSGNNLVRWQAKYGEAERPHQPLYESKSNRELLRQLEDALFCLYREDQDEISFGKLEGIFGGRYPLLGYLYFLKDKSKYLPIAPTFFDRAFECLGAAFKTSHRCSWENYGGFIGLIGELKSMLLEALGGEVSLLDAHSFAWMLAAQMDKAGRLADAQAYLNLSASEREAIVKARVGQGRFRQSLLDYWSTCAVTSCAETALLRASHIKPWAHGTLDERLGLYNGLLLCPNVDACFDAGYISFSDDGQILISKQLKLEDAYVLGINGQLRLRRVEPEHRKYLAYHRENCFKR